MTGARRALEVLRISDTKQWTLLITLGSCHVLLSMAACAGFYTHFTWLSRECCWACTERILLINSWLAQP